MKRKREVPGRSLDILAELDVLVRASGRTVAIKVTPLTPTPELARDGNGKPIVLLPGDTFTVTSRRDLHAVALEALRRAERIEAEVGP